MAKEIERKFLVRNDSYRKFATESSRMVQGYLCTAPDATVRVRVDGDRAWLTVKSRNAGAVRNEWEYPVPVCDAMEMLGACCGDTLVEKVRYRVAADEDGLIWEVDEFAGRLAGLVVAEIELPTADAPFGLPDFIGKEVTDDARYYNSVLAERGIPI